MLGSDPYKQDAELGNISRKTHSKSYPCSTERPPLRIGSRTGARSKIGSESKTKPRFGSGPKTESDSKTRTGSGTNTGFNSKPRGSHSSPQDKPAKSELWQGINPRRSKPFVGERSLTTKIPTEAAATGPASGPRPTTSPEHLRKPLAGDIEPVEEPLAVTTGPKTWSLPLARDRLPIRASKTVTFGITASPRSTIGFFSATDPGTPSPPMLDLTHFTLHLTDNPRDRRLPSL
jgi:hypothetical protein